MLDGFLGSMFNRGFKLCGRCLTNESRPTIAEVRYVGTDGVREELRAKAKEAGKAEVCMHCEEFPEEEEILDRDDMVQVALLALPPQALQDASARYIGHKKELWDEARAAAKKAAEERAQRREEQRAKDEAEGVEYEEKGIFRQRVRKEKPDETA